MCEAPPTTSMVQISKFPGNHNKLLRDTFQGSELLQSFLPPVLKCKHFILESKSKDHQGIGRIEKERNKVQPESKMTFMKMMIRRQSF